MKKNLIINKTLTLFSFIIVLFGSFSLAATHIVGGDLSYKCLGNNEYEVTLTVRRDCFNGSINAPFDDPAYIAIFRSDGWFMKGLGDDGSGVIEIPLSTNDTLNEMVTSECGFLGDQVCVETTTYRKTVMLPFLEEGYTLAYQRCCRNNTLNNIVDPEITGSAYFADISKESQELCNSSPAFIDWAPVYLCKDEILSFDHSAVDPDGDELVYSLCNPFTALNDIVPLITNFTQLITFKPPFEEIQWQSPYTISNVLGGEALSIDPQTGIMTGNPNLVGQFLVGVCVEEFRDGVSLGKTIRDFQFNVRVCTDPPIVDFDFDILDCGTTTIVFNNQSVDADNYKWLFDLGNGTIETSTEVNPSYTFPDFGNYMVTLVGTREADYCLSTVTKEVEVESFDVETHFSVKIPSCKVGEKILYLEDESYSEIEDYPVKWVVVQGADIYTSNNYTWQIDLQNEEDIFVQLIAGSGNCADSLSQTFTVASLQTLVINIPKPTSGCGHFAYDCLLDTENGGPRYYYEGHLVIPSDYQLCDLELLTADFNHGTIDIVSFEQHAHIDGQVLIAYSAYIDVDDADIFRTEDSYIIFDLCEKSNPDNSICFAYLLEYKSCYSDYDCRVEPTGVSRHNNDNTLLDINYCLNLSNVNQANCSVSTYTITAMMNGYTDEKSIFSKTIEGDFDKTVCIKIPILVEDFLSGNYNCIELFIEGDCPGISCSYLDCHVFYNNEGLEKQPDENGAILATNDIDKQAINIFPNPVDKFLVLTYRDLNSENDLNIKMSNILSQNIKIDIAYQNDRAIVDFSKIKSGIYFISVFKMGKLIWSEKIVKI